MVSWRTFTTNDLALLNKSNKDIEILWLKIINPHSRNYIIGITYRPPTGNVQTFTNTIEDCLNQIDKLNEYNVFVLGDMNINYLVKKSPSRKQMTNLENSTGLKQIIDTPTRITSNSSTLIDLLLTNTQHVADYGVLQLNISEHEAVFLSRKKMKEKFVTKTIDARSYVNYDKHQFQQSLMEFDWGTFYQINDPNQAWLYMEETINKIVSMTCPIRKIRIKEKEHSTLTLHQRVVVCHTPSTGPGHITDLDLHTPTGQINGNVTGGQQSVTDQWGEGITAITRQHTTSHQKSGNFELVLFIFGLDQENQSLVHTHIKEKDEPWINNELIELIHDKIALSKIATTTKQAADIERPGSLETIQKLLYKNRQGRFYQRQPRKE